MTDAPIPPRGGLIDWKIPLFFLLSLAVSSLVSLTWTTYGAGQWKATIEAEVSSNTHRLDVQRGLFMPDHDKVTRFDERITAMQAALARIEAKLDHIAP